MMATLDVDRNAESTLMSSITELWRFSQGGRLERGVPWRTKTDLLPSSGRPRRSDVTVAAVSTSRSGEGRAAAAAAVTHAKERPPRRIALRFFGRITAVAARIPRRRLVAKPGEVGEANRSVHLSA